METPLCSVFLPAADIPRFVGEGNVHLGITGQDMVAEADVNGLVSEVLPLEFGKCKLQVQVPENGPVSTVQDLVGKKVVTSFEVLAGRYFGELDEKAGKEKGATKIEYIGGSVEAACALGLADGIGEFRTSLFCRWFASSADVWPSCLYSRPRRSVLAPVSRWRDHSAEQADSSTQSRARRCVQLVSTRSRPSSPPKPS